ncbi:integrin beta-1-like [Haliotis rubra]|uniref:integrin beta-1-like n=1 Tax=Haliotis rubra TaxID=36100 RepID=UPI001EE5F33C|nr:integrin beta-1-like [Haliotis rubra]
MGEGRLPSRTMWSQVILLGSVLSACYACQGRTCGQCVTSGGNCAWCSELVIVNPEDRCGTIEEINKTCSIANITFPSNNIEYNENNNVTDGVDGKESVQLQPQRLTLQIRPNSKVTVPLRYQAARNYPVDLYFLFDLSFTMNTHKKKLANLAGKIANKIGSISNNYRLGFGYFQDKVILPFTNTIPSRLVDPCNANERPRCSEPYGYRHRLNFTKDVSMFVESVETANVTGNIDAPEGGLDAIMQAVTCEKQLGWRESARKLLIYSSDSTFHAAGDGRLAGIVIPNDGQCHLDTTGKNPQELIQDYPSVGQIAYWVSKRKVNIIFAIANQDAKDGYDKLSEVIVGSSVDVLDANSSNVIKIVKDNYEAIISEVTLKVDAPPNVTVTLIPDCTSKNKVLPDKCKGITIGKPVDFEVEILATGCPADPADRVQNITITPVNLPETMTVTLEFICQCDCEKPGRGEANSSRCSGGNGTYQCGVCSCNEGRFGKTCECNRGDLSSSETESCQGPNSTVPCSGVGKCECGQCVCRRGYSGSFCECHDNACPTYAGRTCGGPTQGRCSCGVCFCNEGYTGKSCECATSPAGCLDDKQELCSGNGTCVCGQCKCREGYVGRLCDKCPTCPGVCADSRTCAECVAFGTGLPEIECLKKCGHVVKVDNIDEDDNGTCKLKDEDRCTMKFKVIYNSERNTTIHVQDAKDCPKEVDIVPIVLGVIGGILAVGLLLLILWKILTSLYDGIEYARFNEEINNPQWGQVRNPIFRDPTTTFNNPNFEKSEPLADD